MQDTSVFKKYGYIWVTLILFIFSLTGHWYTAWKAFQNEQEAHNQPVVVSEYVTQTLRDTLENWQSEFLQLMWQVAGLSLLLYVGSTQSKEGDERKEEKIDELLKLAGGKKADKIIKKLNKKYPKK